ncbi:hypothetical protein NG895_12350 [Aeoliella sp. ICT_H6.2]|uniref:Uncharacterized protein n=1 Tax=Aeoliella straminimaris TaxID=2954799 RepID=A0A9X2F9B8_9BACT|nr:hypothetical protein [Aeoliella straminimaris]MCO6044700.1 hypothetical protein [Aeoliella straminimaris]
MVNFFPQRLTVWRILRNYRKVLDLVDRLARKTDCPPRLSFRNQVAWLCDGDRIGHRTAGRLRKLATLVRKAAVGESLAPESLEQLLGSARRLRRKLENVDRNTRQAITIDSLAATLGLPGEWITKHWLQRSVDPMPTVGRGRFVLVDELDAWVRRRAAAL